MTVPSDILSTAFLGPWAKSAGASARRQHVYLSLAHWYEAAKFMPHKPEMRDILLFSPSIKEARKFARLRQNHWRPDWSVTRHTVLVAGLGLLTIQCPNLGLRTCDLQLVRDGLRDLELPDRFVDGVLERFDKWRHAPRIATFGAAIAPESLVGTRLSKLVSPLPNWTLITPCHRAAAWRVHDWALTHYVPVQYVGNPADRASRHLAALIVHQTDQVVVFEQRKQKSFDHVLQLAKSLKKTISLELYDHPAGGTGQLEGMSSAQ